MTIQHTTHEVLEAIRKSQSLPQGDPRLLAFGLEKSTFSQPTSATDGLAFYDLEPGAKFLAPVLTPLRNETPRVSGRGGIQANWRAITGINTNGLRLGVSGGNRAGVQAVTTADYFASYKGIGLETSVDFEAEYAGVGFDDVRAQAGLRGLQATMIGEEALILGGNNSLALGQTPTPTLTASASGGSLASGTLSVICVALSLDGFINGSVLNGVQSQITRTNADGSSDIFGGGAAQKSTNATVAVTGPSGVVAAVVATVRGALGYAWFWGAAGSEVLGAITSVNSVSISAAAAGTQTAASLPGADWSNNALVFDGLLTIALKPGSGAYVASQASGDGWRRNAADGGWRGRRRRDRRGAEIHVGQLSSFARHHLGQQPGGAEHLEEDSRRLRQFGAALYLQRRAGRDRRRRDGADLSQPLLDERRLDAGHPRASELAGGNHSDDRAQHSLSAVGRRQCVPDQNAPRLLSDRMAAAHAPL